MNTIKYNMSSPVVCVHSTSPEIKEIYNYFINIFLHIKLGGSKSGILGEAQK